VKSTALAAIAVLAVGAARAETLADAVATAYQSNPTLQQQRASQRALDETYVQAIDGYNPTLNLVGTVTTDSNNTALPLQNLPGINQQLVPGQTQTSAAALQLSQPLFTGGRVARQVDAARATVRAGRQALRGVEETLLASVIQVYVDTRRDQQIEALDEDNLRILKGQLDEATARFGVGEITKTDVAETQAGVAAAEAALAAARANLANSRAAYAAIVGHEPGDLATEPPLTALLPASLDAASAVAGQHNPQILQQDFAQQASAAKVAEARAQTRPSLTLQASMGYLGGAAGLHTPFSRYSHDITASAVATFPIFSGGVMSSQIRQAAETHVADEIGVEAARREAAFTVAQAWNNLAGARASRTAEEAQVKAAQVAFEGMRIESRVGQRSVLDVLITQQNLSAARTALLVARRDEYFAGAQLLAAMGTLNVGDLVPGAPIYDPKVHFDRVSREPFWAPWRDALGALDRVGAPDGK
jgi:outer membrane protein